jgi:subfamily B ATP-binding cassette protein MsbA
MYGEYTIVSHFSNISDSILPSNNQSPKSPTGSSAYLRLLTYVRPYIGLFAISMLGYLLYAGTQPAVAVLLQKVIDAMEAKNPDLVYWIPAALVGVIAIRSVGSFLGSYFLARVSNSIVHTLRCEVFDHYTTLPASYFDNENPGHMISRVTYNVTQVTDAATDALKVIVREGLTVIALLGYITYINWQLSLIFLALTPIIAFIVGKASKRFRKISHKIQSSMGDVTHVSSELINGYRVVRSFGGEDEEKQRFHHASHKNFKQSLRLATAAAIHTPLLQLIVTAAIATLVALALSMMNEATTGEFIAYITAAILIPKPVRLLSSVNSKIQKGIAAAQSVFEVLDQPGELDLGQQHMTRATGRVVFKNVSFNYPNTEVAALKNISFVAEPGQTIALVGHSGSGKSTLINLLPRFYDVSSGVIQLDDVDIQQLTLTDLRRQISLVPQQVTLFNDTIAHNIAYGSLHNATPKQIEAAAEAANALDFISKFPTGFNTMAGENGVRLSGGERQRLAIARALLKDAPLLILDEATSALDSASERKIQNALEHAMSGRTTIVIAHRLSTVEKADKILVLQQGRIVESGTHQQLLALNKHYARLHQLQFRDQAENPKH